MADKRTRTNAADILDRRHPPTGSDPDVRASFRADYDIAEMIHQVRTDARLSQRELAKLVGTSASVICRLEDADYDGQSMGMQRRIAAALKQRVGSRLVPRDQSRREIA